MLIRIRIIESPFFWSKRLLKTGMRIWIQRLDKLNQGRSGSATLLVFKLIGFGRINLFSTI